MLGSVEKLFAQSDKQRVAEGNDTRLLHRTQGQGRAEETVQVENTSLGVELISRLQKGSFYCAFTEQGLGGLP